MINLILTEPERITLLHLSPGSDYYQGGKIIPRPLNITRYAAVGPIEVTAFEVLALTKMD